MAVESSVDIVHANDVERELHCVRMEQNVAKKDIYHFLSPSQLTVHVNVILHREASILREWQTRSRKDGTTSDVHERVLCLSSNCASAAVQHNPEGHNPPHGEIDMSDSRIPLNICYSLCSLYSSKGF